MLRRTKAQCHDLPSFRRSVVRVLEEDMDKSGLMIDPLDMDGDQEEEEEGVEEHDDEGDDGRGGRAGGRGSGRGGNGRARRGGGRGSGGRSSGRRSDSEIKVEADIEPVLRSWYAAARLKEYGDDETEARRTELKEYRRQERRRKEAERDERNAARQKRGAGNGDGADAGDGAGAGAGPGPGEDDGNGVAFLGVLPPDDVDGDGGDGSDGDDGGDGGDSGDGGDGGDSEDVDGPLEDPSDGPLDVESARALSKSQLKDHCQREAEAIPVEDLVRRMPVGQRLGMSKVNIKSKTVVSPGDG